MSSSLSSALFTWAGGSQDVLDGLAGGDRIMESFRETHDPGAAGRERVYLGNLSQGPQVASCG